MTGQIACAVLSLRNEPGLTAAVQSLLAQEEPLEVVVVNSGGHDPTDTLREAGIEVPVIHRKERLYVGGARNLGIDATRAPYVAFLAADCIALPG
jgi:glycosyltransferase involved in cell wall biosynthesis